METSIKYNEIKDISQYVTSKSEELDTIYKEIDKTIDSVVNVWQGNDCDTFVNEAKKYISDEQEKRNKLTKFGEILSTISGDYIDMENNWNEQLKRES